MKHPNPAFYSYCGRVDRSTADLLDGTADHVIVG